MAKIEIEETASGFWWRVRDTKGQAVMQAVKHEKSAMECGFALNLATAAVCDANKASLIEFEAAMIKRRITNAANEEEYPKKNLGWPEEDHEDTP